MLTLKVDFDGARVPHVDESDIQRPRLEVLKRNAATAAGPNTALQKRLRRPDDNNGKSSRDLRY